MMRSPRQTGRARLNRRREKENVMSVTNNNVTRRCFRKPIDEIFEVALLLDCVVDAHLAEKRDEAIELLVEADKGQAALAATQWVASVARETRPEIHQLRDGHVHKKVDNQT